VSSFAPDPDWKIGKGNQKDRDYGTGLLSTSILQYQALSGGNEKERNVVSALSVNRPGNHSLPDRLL
jgi:hypothetical protein